MKILHKEITVRASLDAVWNAWTTTDGMRSFFAPEAYIDLRIGGAYEVYFLLNNPRGLQGSEDCKIVSYLPMRMLSFTWNCPPEFEAARASKVFTWCVLLFDEIAPGTVRVDFSELGWPNTEEWNKIYDYFDKAWESVLASLKETLEA